MSRPLLRILVLATAVGLQPLSSAAASPDWNAAATTDTVQVITKNQDGTLKTTTVWLAVVDGQGYIRTGNTRWWANIERDRDVTLRVQGSDYPLRVEVVEEPDLRQRVEDAFRAKYGWVDRALEVVRSGSPHIMKLLPRPE
ncbi:MAG TPA: DUF2255 family protein [Myxococcota bacterium]|nr:DUF2255 family protein [Myxococcota bacterium]